MQNFTYRTQGVCAREISFDIENDKVYNINFMGGCSGNLSAICKLLEGSNIDYVIEKLEGNICGSKSTSCADQLTKALKIAKTKEN